MGQRGRRPGVKRKKGAIQWCRTTFIRYKQLLLTGVLLIALLLLLFGICNQLQAPDLNAPPTGTTVIDYGTFLAQVRAGHVLEVSLQDQDIVGLLAKPVERRHVHRFWKRAAPERRASEEPEAHGGDTSPRGRSVHEDTSSPVRPELKPPSVTFADVAGIDEVRQEVEELVQFLRAPERFERLGARIPRGALLVGPPGTGKTLLAKAVAGEAGVSFFSVSASEFVEMYVGVGAKRVRDLFLKAREHAPCVIFVDELDAVGRKRTPGLGGSDERDQTLNQLLVELDGFAARQTIVVLAATNRADILDPALLRPGRFDRHISVSLPDRAGRQAILQVHMRRTPLHEEVSLERITSACFEEALARVLLGAQRPIVLSETDRRIIAFHEAGHALVAHHLPGADRINGVTILARKMVTRWGMSEQVGVMFVEGWAPATGPDLHYHNRFALPARSRTLAIDVDGRLVLNGGDLPARQHRFGTPEAAASEASSASLATLIDLEVQRLLSEGYQMAKMVLTEHDDQLDRLALALMEREQLDRAAFEQLVSA